MVENETYIIENIRRFSIRIDCSWIVIISYFKKKSFIEV